MQKSDDFYVSRPKYNSMSNGKLYVLKVQYSIKRSFTNFCEFKKVRKISRIFTNLSLNLTYSLIIYANYGRP